VIGEQRKRAERNLSCLAAQTAVEEIEVLLVDMTPDRGPVAGEEHPAVRRLEHTDDDRFWNALAKGARAARSEIVAFIEDHCFAEPGWAAAVIEAYRKPVAMVNYAFTDTDPQTYLSRSFLMTEYGRWMAPAKAGPVGIASCNNISYRREVLARYFDRLEEWLKVEYLLHRDIQRNGGVVWLAPDAVVAHEDWLRLRDGFRANGAMKRFHGSGMAFSGTPWSRTRRLIYAAAMALTPPLHLWRLARSVWNRPALWLPFVTALPVSVSVYCYMAYCEALGYLLGPGSSEADFTATELSLSRKA